MAPAAVRCRVSKRFGGTHALEDVEIAFACGEIHGVLGQNGAGKSTLFKILAGVYAPEDGSELEVGGDAVGLPLTPSRSAGLGFSFVHQDLGLAESLTVSENVCVGGFETGRLGRIRWRAQNASVAALLAEFGVDVSPTAGIATLTQSEKAMVAIARAIHAGGAGGTRLLVLDEPTAYLTPSERDRLFQAMRAAADSGVAVVFCTHHIDEVREVTDRVSVLKDGRLAMSALTADVPDDEALVEAILGRKMTDFYPDREVVEHDDVVLRVEGLSGGSIADASFDVHRGEIVGITGLMGGGHDELPYMVVGANPVTAGTVAVEGRVVPRMTPRRASKLGIGLLPANRPRDSGILSATLRENLTIVCLQQFAPRMRINHRREREASLELLSRFDVRPSDDPDRELGALSGGNQQKVLIAKWLQKSALDCMILHEPTQGVDVGAKQTILALVRDLAARGVAVLLVSTEHEDLSHLCDRVLVMRSGRIVAHLRAPSTEEIEQECYATVSGSLRSPGSGGGVRDAAAPGV